LTRRAERDLANVPHRDRAAIQRAIDRMSADPSSVDLAIRRDGDADPEAVIAQRDS
jgi:hypothetical protein